MCDPVSIGLGIAGAGLSLYGATQQASAAKQQQQAIADANAANQRSQQEGFVARNQAAQQQTAAQLAASEQTMEARNNAATQMRQAQSDAMQRYQDVLKAENEQADTLRQTGDTAAQQLLQSTNAQQLQQTQAQREQEQAQLAAGGVPQTPPGPDVTDPSGSTNAVTNDLVAGGAAARRTAEAATNIRQYGARIARADAYGAPLQWVGLNIADTGYGIMPAEVADRLLRGGSGTRLLPTQIAYGGATSLGQAQDQLLQSHGERALEGAALSYGNAKDLADLRQSNEETATKNTELQAEANASAKASTGKIISGIGGLALQGAGYFAGQGGVPAGSLFGSQGPIFGSAADASIAAGGPPLAPGGGPSWLSSIFSPRIT